MAGGAKKNIRANHKVSFRTTIIPEGEKYLYIYQGRKRYCMDLEHLGYIQ